MKAPKEAKQLAKHRKQAFDYWSQAADPEAGVPAPRYVVICAFRRLEIWEPGAFPSQPRAVLDLIDLPDQYDALLFLAVRDAVFAGGQAQLTREAVVTSRISTSSSRNAAPPTQTCSATSCSSRSGVSLAEDLGQLPAHRFTRIVEELRLLVSQDARSPRRSWDEPTQIMARS